MFGAHISQESLDAERRVVGGFQKCFQVNFKREAENAAANHKAADNIGSVHGHCVPGIGTHVDDFDKDLVAAMFAAFKIK